MKQRNTAASVRDRLIRHARETNQDPNRVLVRFAGERLLHRLSLSPYADRFVLKGALLFELWFDTPHRPTRDIDLLSYGESDAPSLAALFRTLCAIEADDGVIFQSESLSAEEIRATAEYAGVRITLLAVIDGARCPLQIDVGFGDVVTPDPETVGFPALLSEFPAPTLRVYPRETVVAEKFEAIVVLGIANSRMKDYFDLWVLCQSCTFHRDTLEHAIRATFERRRTPLPIDVPFGLTDDFSLDRAKVGLWRAFQRRNRLDIADLDQVVAMLRSFLEPLIAERDADPMATIWAPGGPWR